jgi:DNA-binding MarR family transcriptional regulator
MGATGALMVKVARLFTLRFGVDLNDRLTTNVKGAEMRHGLIGFAADDPRSTIGDPFPFSRTARICRELIKARARRKLFFKSSLFSDFAWDILLVLFVVSSEGRKLSILEIARKSGVSATTSLRWIDALEREGLVERQEHPTDGRRTFVNLSDAGFESMRAYVEEENPRSALVM